MLWPLQLLAVLLLAAGGLAAGRAIAARRWWMLGFLVSLAGVLVVVVGRRSVALSFVPPFSWAVSAGINYLLMAALVPLMLMTLAGRLPVARQRRWVYLMLAVMVVYYSLLPVLAPVVVRPLLAGGRTSLDASGVCRQTHNYTCGPAAAVTVLRQLGLPAEEGLLAAASNTCPMLGADPAVLADTIAQRFPVGCSYRYLGTVDRLRTSLPAVASLTAGPVSGHYVAVLEADNRGLAIGDPLSGRYTMSEAEFAGQWSGAALVFTRR